MITKVITITKDKIKQLQSEFAYFKNNSITKESEMIKEKLLDIDEIDDVVIETVQEHWKEAIRVGANYKLGKLLEEKLCSFGGEALCYDYDEYAKIILDDGQLWYGDEIYYKEMKLKNCHDNTAKLHQENPNYPIVIGYALSEYGFWYNHTWSLKKEQDGSRVIETTIPAVLYYGVVLSKKDADYFIARYSNEN